MQKKRNWKTTVFGVLALAMAGFQIYNNPASLGDPTTSGQILGAIASGIGLITAKDASNHDVPPPPVAPVQ